MRRILSLSVLALSAGLLSACAVEKVIDTPDIPTAGVRFIHAVPDTGAMDFRAVDIVENSAHYGITFRNMQAAIVGGFAFYKNAQAGSRNFRIFMSGTTAAIASTVVKDTVVNLEAGKRYTFILWGYARSGSSPGMRLTVLEDNPNDPGTQIAFRVVNAASGLDPLDVRLYPFGGTVPAGPTFGGVAALTNTAYSTQARGRTSVNVQPGGGGTALINSECIQRGVAATVDIEAVPGTEVAGSALSVIVFPRSVSGSAAPNVTAPSMICIWDRRPPRAPGL